MKKLKETESLVYDLILNDEIIYQDYSTKYADSKLKGNFYRFSRSEQAQSPGLLNDQTPPWDSGLSLRYSFGKVMR